MLKIHETPNEDAIVEIAENNNDGTTDRQFGSMSPFNITVISNVGASVIPAEYQGSYFYGYGDTLPSDADVEVSR